MCGICCLCFVLCIGLILFIKCNLWLLFVLYFLNIIQFDFLITLIISLIFSITIIIKKDRTTLTRVELETISLIRNNKIIKFKRVNQIEILPPSSLTDTSIQDCVNNNQLLVIEKSSIWIIDCYFIWLSKVFSIYYL